MKHQHWLLNILIVSKWRSWKDRGTYSGDEGASYEGGRTQGPGWQGFLFEISESRSKQPQRWSWYYKELFLTPEEPFQVFQSLSWDTQQREKWLISLQSATELEKLSREVFSQQIQCMLPNRSQHHYTTSRCTEMSSSTFQRWTRKENLCVQTWPMESW